MKTAVLSMDIEDWYHLDYFAGMKCERQISLLDGIGAYQDILSEHDVPSSFFVLGELVGSLKSVLGELVSQGHEVGVHGWDHTRPMKLESEVFSSEVIRAKETLEDALGFPAVGYRAPCFSLDRERLDRLKSIGFDYDSSRISFSDHPLYGDLDVGGFTNVTPHIYRDGSFFEFEVSTLPIAGRNIPVSGGGYLRMLPWHLTRFLINSYIRRYDLYTLYIHPFELSSQPTPPVPDEVSRSTRLRFGLGRAGVPAKLSRLINLLKKRGFQFTTFAALRKTLLDDSVEAHQDG